MAANLEWGKFHTHCHCQQGGDFQGNAAASERWANTSWDDSAAGYASSWLEVDQADSDETASPRPRPRPRPQPRRPGQRRDRATRRQRRTANGRRRSAVRTCVGSGRRGCRLAPLVRPQGAKAAGKRDHDTRRAALLELARKQRSKAARQPCTEVAQVSDSIPRRHADIARLVTKRYAERRW
jgi:hypothetical protein